MSTNKQRTGWTRIEKLTLLGVIVSIISFFVFYIIPRLDGPTPNGEGGNNDTTSYGNSTGAIPPPPTRIPSPPPDTSRVRVRIHVLHAGHPVSIFLDDVNVGQSPCTLRIAKGSHSLVLRYTDNINRVYELSRTIYVEGDTSLTYDVHNFRMR